MYPGIESSADLPHNIQGDIRYLMQIYAVLQEAVL